MSVQERVLSLAQPLAAPLGLDIVAVEWIRENGRRILRVTIDKPAGISHADCEALSRRLDAQLDAAGTIGEAYLLEVSSPGAERPLATDEDFRRFAGRRVFIKLREPFGGRREWRGNLVRATAETVVVAYEGGEMALPRGTISRARLSIE